MERVDHLSQTFTIESLQRQGDRAYQEDRYIILDLPGNEFVLAAVFDGMGGKDDGELAASLGMHAVADAFISKTYAAYRMPPGEIARQCLLHAQEQTLRFIEDYGKGPEHSPGSTALVAVISREGAVGISWLGDSPAAIWDGSKLNHITGSHVAACDTAWAEISGQEARGSGLTRHLGEQVYQLGPEIRHGKFHPNHVLLLMSDGAQEAIRNAGEERLSETSAVDLVASLEEDRLSDNTTLIAIRPNQEEAVEEEEPCNPE